MATGVAGERVDGYKRLALEFHGPFKSGNVGALDGILHPDWVNNPRNAHEGYDSEGYKDTIRWMRSVFPDIEVLPEELIEVGDKVVVRSVGTGTQRAEFLGVPPTGKRFTFRALEIHRFEDGRIVESWHIQDYYAMLAQLGAIENVMRDQIDPYPAWE